MQLNRIRAKMILTVNRFILRHLFLELQQPSGMSKVRVLASGTSSDGQNGKCCTFRINSRFLSRAEHAAMPFIFLPSLSRDAWAKHKDLDSYEAKLLYVEKLLSVRCPTSYFPLPRSNATISAFDVLHNLRCGV